MAMNFPASPTNGQEFASGDFIYVYDGEKWTSKVTIVEGPPEVARVEARYTSVAGQTAFAMNNDGATDVDVFYNGIKLDSVTDYSVAGDVVTLTEAVVLAEDVLEIVSWNSFVLMADPAAEGDYLPLTGGTLSGNLTVQTTSPVMSLDDVDGKNFWMKSDGGAFTLEDAVTGSRGMAFFPDLNLVEVPEITTKLPQRNAADALTRKDYVDAAIPTRKKGEVHWAGLSATLVANTPVNIMDLLGGMPPPVSGSWGPLVDFSSGHGKIKPFNDNRTLNFKMNLIGTWSGGSTNRALQLDFTDTVGNRIVVIRDPNISPSPNSIQFATFFSVDKDGNMALNGTEPIITALGGDFTINEVLWVTEQTTTLS